jgi:hypothetical protein
MNWLLSLLTGGIIGQIAGPLNQAYRDKLAADSNDKKLAAEQAIAFYEGQMKLAVEASKNDRWWSTRELIGKCALIYVFKIVVFDTVLKLGNTPDPGPQVTGIVMLVLGFYFGSKAVVDLATRLLGMVRR